MTSWLREPLLHFAVAGVFLLGVSYAFNGNGSEPPRGTIVVSESDTARLADGFARLFNRAPTATERQNLIAEYIREEVYVREALRLGLDQDDPVIRNRLVQKMGILADDLSARAPTEAELQAHLDANLDAYTGQPLLSFDQALLDDPAAVIASGADPLAAATPSTLPPTLTDVSKAQVAARFGSEFADTLSQMESDGAWAGPVPSSLGRHAVRLRELSLPKPPTLDRLRPRLVTDVTRIRTSQAKARAFETLRERYTIEIAE